MININKKFLIIASTIVIVYLILMILIFFNSQSNNPILSKNPSLPTPTSVEIQTNPNSVPNQNSSVDFTNQEVEETKKERNLGSLLLKLPHKGVFFELSYEYETDSFNLTLDASNPQQADGDLETFLKPLDLTKEDLQNLSISSK